MHTHSLAALLTLLAATTVTTATAAAQVQPGSAIVAWKPPAGGPGGLKLVDRAGVSTDITGLDAATVGTSTWDGARSVLVTDTGEVYAGLSLDNRSTRTPRPLDLRRITLSGSVATSDQVFTTVMMVGAGELWYLSDIEQFADGSLLVGATEVLFTANPMPRTAAFVVASNGSVTALPTTGFPAGSLLAVAVAGDRWVGAFEQSFFVVNVELVSFPLTATGQVPFRVTQLVNVSSFGGLDTDVDGTLIVCAASSLGSGCVARVAHAPNATPVLVPGSPAGATAADAVPAAGLVAVFALPRNPLSPLVLVDTLAGGATTWSAGVVSDPVDIAVRRNPTSYGAASPVGTPVPYLGSFGGLPRAGNAQFGFRVGGTPGSVGALLAGFGRGSLPTPFGQLLLDATLPIVVLAPLSLPNSGETRVPVPLPGSTRGRLDLQAVLLTNVAPPIGETTAGLELTIQ